MVTYLFLFATIAFAALAILFFVHYRKMVDLEVKLNSNMVALNRSEARSEALQISLDTNSSKFDQIIACFHSAQTNEEKISCIGKLIGD